MQKKKKKKMCQACWDLASGYVLLGYSVMLRLIVLTRLFQRL